VVAELLKLKAARNASPRYIADLEGRLASFTERFQKDACDVTTAEVQEWLDAKKLSSQSYMNNRRVVHLLFEHAVARGYAIDNPVAGVESVKIRGGETEVFTPGEIQQLLAAATPEFQIVLAIGAFAGLRSAEIERLEWSDVRFKERCIVVGASKAKTASRRVVPICDNLASWLAPYAQHSGNVWRGAHDEFYDAQQDTAKAAGLRWKSNGLRHSYASYRFALTNDAGRVAGELGNSASVVHKHYRELVTAKDAARWFAITPNQAAGVMPVAFGAVA
jgi:integrase